MSILWFNLSIIGSKQTVTTPSKSEDDCRPHKYILLTPNCKLPAQKLLNIIPQVFKTSTSSEIKGSVRENTSKFKNTGVLSNKG